MRYEISKSTAPTMPTLGKGTECIKLLLSQASKGMHEPLVPMFFPYLVHISGAEFRSQDSCIRHRYQSNTVMSQPNTVPYQAKPCAYQPNITLTWMFFCL